MSLLMDALKKAEQEKREAAKRLKEAQNNLPQDELSETDSQIDMMATQEFSIEDQSTDLDQKEEEQAPLVESQDELDVTSQQQDISLSPITNEQPVVEDINSGEPLIEEPLPVETPVADSFSISVEENVQPENDQLPGDQLPGDDKPEPDLGEITASEGTPVEKQTLALTDFQVDEVVTEPVEDTVEARQVFDDAHTLSDVADEYFSSTVSVAQLAEDIGGDSPTPVAAQTVFTAISRGGSNQVFQWGVFAVLSLVILVSLSFFVFNYTVPVERSIKSPLVARDIETQDEPVLQIEMPDKLVSNAEIDSSVFTGEITDVIEKANVTGNGAPEQTVVENILPADSESAVINETRQETPTEHHVAIVDEVQEEIWYPSDDVSAEEYAISEEVVEELTSSLPDKITPEPELIKISRSKSIDKTSALVNKAYEEYLAGDFDTAEENYRIVLNNLPENRDALLGLAAISLQKGDVRQAYINYLEVLRLYPGDSVAEAALINFNNNEDNSRSESILKTFLQSEPDNSFLHYSLARLYAAQTRWPEAQQSFFDAHRIESSNADYAFNLAVSLEHIGQQQSAIDYYNVALDLADNSAVNFDSSVAISRINALSHQTDLQ